MGPAQARFVTACQQMLALGAVLAVLTPAASVISLDVVGRDPEPAPVTRAALRPMSASVPTAAVDPVVKEYSLTAPAGSRLATGRLQARVVPDSTSIPPCWCPGRSRCRATERSASRGPQTSS